MTSFVYILECSDKSYYVGSTHNLDERLSRHASGDWALWTAKRLPVKLVYSEICSDDLIARRREAQIKWWTRDKKERLIRWVWK
jgi:putative endonuclease